MRKKLFIIFYLALAFFDFSSFNEFYYVVTLDELKAFPTAEGWARGERTFASSPAIRKVTNLNNSGSGSLRTAVETAGNAIIIFEIAGEILVDTPITVGAGKHIAGQTAFVNGGQGITIRPSGSFSGNAPLIGLSNSVVRFLRIRGGNDSYLTEFPTGGTSLIFDHCSFSYGGDEVVDFYATTASTMQHCIIAEGVSGSGFTRGMIFSAGAERITLYGNLFSNNHQRNPLIGGDSNTGQEFELINNYVFNPGGWGINMNNNNSGSNLAVNLIGNRIHRGNGSSGTRYLITGKEESGSSYYLLDNKDGLFRTTDGQDQADIIGDANDLTSEIDNSFVVGTAFNYPFQSNGTIHDVDNLRNTVINHVGAYLFRDAIDQRQIDQIDANTGLSSYLTSIGAYPSVSNMSSVPVDVNNDGIPDGFTSAFTVVNNAGYPAIELYLSEIAGDFLRLDSSGPVAPTTRGHKKDENSIIMF